MRRSGKASGGPNGRRDGGGLLTGTGRTWCKDSRKALFLRFLCTKSSALSHALQLRTWCKDSRKALLLRFLCTKSSALSHALQLRTWCKDSRKALLLRFLCTKSSALSPRHRARSVPWGKHFRGTSLPFPQKQKEAAPAAPLPTSSPIRRKSLAGDFRLLFSTENP